MKRARGREALGLRASHRHALLHPAAASAASPRSSPAPQPPPHLNTLNSRPLTAPWCLGRRASSALPPSAPLWMMRSGFHRQMEPSASPPAMKPCCVCVHARACGARQRVSVGQRTRYLLRHRRATRRATPITAGAPRARLARPPPSPPPHRRPAVRAWRAPAQPRKALGRLHRAPHKLEIGVRARKVELEHLRAVFRSRWGPWSPAQRPPTRGCLAP